MRGLGAALADLWYLSRPYFTSDERKSAWGLLGVVLGLTLLLVGADVLQSFSRNIFYTALQQRDVTSFLRGLFWFVRTPTMLIPGFFIIAVPTLLAAVYATYLQQLLQLRWRRWLTHRMVSQWLDQNIAFRIAIEETGLTAVGDNPDQRIQEDIDGFVRNTLSQFLDIVSRLVTLFSYVGLLWVLSGAISIFGVRIPGYFLCKRPKIALLTAVFAFMSDIG
ncbi:SbmA/BacA-like family transporter [Brytella acorum]|uniref:SbmA/BacA-like family transporter n=1 Tax=Brytella acorum TaxID=2959299 RepID=UPI0030EF2573